MEDKGLSYSPNSSADFINNLDFDYVKIYSFCRGEKYEHFKNRVKEVLPYTEYLTEKNGGLHPSAEHTHTFKKDSEELGRIREILSTELVESISMLCAPIYRDGIIFYNAADERVAVVNICLSCAHMQLESFNYLKADILTFDLLKKFFIDVGHAVEEKERFFLSKEMMKQREKVLKERRDELPR